MSLFHIYLAPAVHFRLPVPQVSAPLPLFLGPKFLRKCTEVFQRTLEISWTCGYWCPFQVSFSKCKGCRTSRFPWPAIFKLKKKKKNRGPDVGLTTWFHHIRILKIINTYRYKLSYIFLVYYSLFCHHFMWERAL